jgi:hypothetical protein
MKWSFPVLGSPLWHACQADIPGSRRAIGDLAIAAAELAINRAIGPFPQN